MLLNTLVCAHLTQSSACQQGCFIVCTHTSTRPQVDPHAVSGLVAKVADFGLSAALGPDATHVSNFRAGTRPYMAPEVAAECRMTRASDIYSLGVVMWCVLASSMPHEWVGGTWKLHSSFLVLPPGTLDGASPAVGQALESLMGRCIAEKAEQRPSAAEVVEVLDQAYSVVEASGR